MTSNFAALMSEAGEYGLLKSQAPGVVDRIVTTISEQFDEGADVARMPARDRTSMFGRQFLNPGALHGL